MDRRLYRQKKQTYLCWFIAYDWIENKSFKDSKIERGKWEMKPRLIKGPTKNKTLTAVVQCPKCERKAWIDHEQFEGKVSMVCECGWHETHDLREEKSPL